MAVLLIEDRGVIYDATQQVPESRVAFFTGLCRLQSGALLCGFQVGTGKHSPDSTIQLSATRPSKHSTTREFCVPGTPGRRVA